MSQSTNIVIRNLTTGAGTTGLTVTLKNHLDNFASVVGTGVEISGKPGVYQFIDLPLAKYKLFIAGTEDTSYGGTHGKWLPIMDTLPTKDGTNEWSGTNGYSTEKTLSDAKEFVYKKWMDTLLALKALITGNNAFVGTNTFNGSTGYSVDKSLTEADNKEFVHKSWHDSAVAALTSLIGAKANTTDVETNYFKKTGGTTTQIVANPVRFNYGIPPVFDAVPTLGNHAVNKNFHDSDVAARIAAIISGNYQESLNIVRVMPSGSDITGSVYNTIGKAIAYCNGLTPASTKQYTLLITGEGTSADIIDYSSYTSPMTQYMRDYVHFKGLGSDIKIGLNISITTNEFKASAVGKVIVEDLYFYTDDGGDTGTQEFENIIFKNCKFYTRELVVATFTNCKFEGTNEFASLQDSAFQFVNCTGSPITVDAHAITISGTSKIVALSNVSGSLKLSGGLNVNGALELAAISTDAGAAISTSDGMLRVKINDRIVHIPYFTI